MDSFIVHDISDFSNIFSVGIVGAGFAARTCELTEYHTATCKGSVLLFVNVCEERVVSCIYIGGKHFGVSQHSAQRKLTILPHSIKKFCYCIFKELGFHTGCTYAADFFFIYQNAACRFFYIFHVQQGFQGSKRANSVILTVGHNHAAVKPCISCLSCRNDFQFSREKILFFHVVFFF